MIKVLQVCSSIGTCGGVQSVLWNYYSHMDSSEIVFDFAVTNKEMKGFEQNFIKNGSKIFVVEQKRRNYFKHFSDLNRVLKNNQYDIIHVNLDWKGFPALFLSYIHGVKTRIMHIHSGPRKESVFSHVVRLLLTFLSSYFATDFFSCSEESATWVFGNGKVNSGRVRIIRDAVDTDKFRFSEEKRNRIRDELKTGNSFVVGNVGRLSEIKNHIFLFEIFTEILKKAPDSKLIIVGDGELREELKQKAKELNLSEKIIFTLSKENVGDYLSAMDVFVFPSKSEGFGLVVVEAQVNSLPCLVSTAVPESVALTEKVKFLSLEESAEIWAKKAISLNGDRKISKENFLKKDFDIKAQAKELFEFYKKSVR